MPAVAYDPNDPNQARLLSALNLGETGGSSNVNLGYGGADLTGTATDQYGFPQWSGVGNTHATGLFQFQPGTWDSVAQQYNLNFQNPQDQAAGAWYLAQSVYSQKTGGDLETALQNGDFQSVQTALGSTWTSVNGNANMPGGLATTLASVENGPAGSDPAFLNRFLGTGAAIGPGGFGGAEINPSASPNTSLGGGSSGLLGAIEDWFVRGGLVILGGIIIVVALWKLLADQGYIPSATKIAKAL